MEEIFLAAAFAGRGGRGDRDLNDVTHISVGLISHREGCLCALLDEPAVATV